MIDIHAYKPQLVAESKRIFPSQLLLDSIEDWSVLETIEEDTPTNIMEALKKPAYIPRKARFVPGPAVHVLFDGGSTAGRGTAGYQIIDTQGNEVCRVGLKLGEGVTNNEAESIAIYKALLHLDDLK